MKQKISELESTLNAAVEENKNAIDNKDTEITGLTQEKDALVQNLQNKDTEINQKYVNLHFHYLPINFEDIKLSVMFSAIH